MQHSECLHKHDSDPLSIRICSHVNGNDIAILFLSLCVRGYYRCFPDPLVYLSQVKMKRILAMRAKNSKNCQIIKLNVL